MKRLWVFRHLIIAFLLQWFLLDIKVKLHLAVWIGLFIAFEGLQVLVYLYQNKGRDWYYNLQLYFKPISKRIDTAADIAFGVIGVIVATMIWTILVRG